MFSVFNNQIFCSIQCLLILFSLQWPNKDFGSCEQYILISNVFTCYCMLKLYVYLYVYAYVCMYVHMCVYKFNLGTCGFPFTDWYFFKGWNGPPAFVSAKDSDLRWERTWVVKIKYSIQHGQIQTYFCSFQDPLTNPQ